MANTINDVSIPHEDWVSVYTLTGIRKGTSISILNKSSNDVILQETLMKPSPTDTNGRTLTTISEAYHTATISGSPVDVWARSYDKFSALVNIQEI